MRTQRVSTLAATALATTALAVPASQAHGDGQRVRSKVTVVHLESGHYAHGWVKADKFACRKNREVKLYIRKPDAHWRLLFTTTTGGNPNPGYWGKSINLHDFPVRYFAVVTRERKGGYLCTRDESPVGREDGGVKALGHQLAAGKTVAALT